MTHAGQVGGAQAAMGRPHGPTIALRVELMSSTNAAGSGIGGRSLPTSARTAGAG
jgi:hypothetical protein